MFDIFNKKKVKHLTKENSALWEEVCYLRDRVTHLENIRVEANKEIQLLREKLIVKKVVVKKKIAKKNK